MAEQLSDIHGCQLSSALHGWARTHVSRPHSRPRPRSRCGRARRKYSSRQIGAPRSLHFNLILQTELDRFAIAGNDSRHFNNSRWAGDCSCGGGDVCGGGGGESEFQVSHLILLLSLMFWTSRSDHIKNTFIWSILSH